MAGVLGTGRKGSVNVELNIIPFVDVMSCLTAFLLVTAVWVNTANLQNKASAKGPAGVPQPDPPSLRVLIETDALIVEARPSGEQRQLAAFDWPHLEQALKELDPTPGTDIRVDIAADSTKHAPISYQQLIAAMDTSVRAGFFDVGVVDPKLFR